MRYKWLKVTRVVIALVFIILTTLVFLDFRELFSENDVNSILFLQFVPSLLKFLTVLSLSAAGFIVILLLTALFGRVYCSSICPLGIFQDVISRTGRFFKKKRKRRYRYSRPHPVLRNSILAVTVIVSVFISILALNLLDPYSLYGKMANGIFRPMGIMINNAAAGILESMNIFFLYLKDQSPVELFSIIFPLIILGVLIYMAGKRGRLYCNTICPVGTLLGWLSRYSLFRIRLNQTSCTQCGKCAVACKAECISVKDMTVDNSRCVACYNCLPVCNDNAIQYSWKEQSHKEVKMKEAAPVMADAATGGRRNFINASVAGLLAAAGVKKLNASGSVSGDDQPLNKKPTTVPVEKTSPVSPPGSLSVDHMNSLCTACHLCVTQCPTGVLRPTVNEYGLLNYMQPHMDYNSNYCNFECTRCTDVCPTGAILPVDTEKKKTLQIGKVTFIKENCVVYTENTACGSCSEHCPTQAVKMVPYKGNLTIPETDNSICVGCGACEYACPVVPYKAIYVDGNTIHQTAEKPKTEKLEEPSMEEDFPF